jgi:hypothetical protein
MHGVHRLNQSEKRVRNCQSHTSSVPPAEAIAWPAAGGEARSPQAGAR